MTQHPASNHTEAEHAEMMAHPDRWPHSFWLPLTRAAEPGTGILWQASMDEPAPPPEPVVYIGNMFDRLPHLLDRQQIRYPDIAAIVADGWRVD